MNAASKAPLHVTSRDNALLQRLRKLAADPAGYRKQGELWLEGEHLCQALLARGGVARQALVTEAAWQQPALRALALQAGAVAIVPAALMQSVSSLQSPAPIGPASSRSSAPNPVLSATSEIEMPVLAE